MERQTYRAATMHEALALVRRELGPDAAVLHTREVPPRRLFGWLPGRGRSRSRPRRRERAQPAAATRGSAMPSAERLAGRAGRAGPLAGAASRPPQPSGSPHRQCKGQLSDLQAMVKDLCRRSQGGGTARPARGSCSACSPT